MYALSMIYKDISYHDKARKLFLLKKKGENIDKKLCVITYTVIRNSEFSARIFNITSMLYILIRIFLILILYYNIYEQLNYPRCQPKVEQHR